MSDLVYCNMFFDVNDNDDLELLKVIADEQKKRNSNKGVKYEK